MKRILVIEDDGQLSSAYNLKLSKDYIVDIAEDGTHGMSLFKQNRPDIVLLDIMLPGSMNGMEILKMIKDDPEQGNTPVIMLTNLSQEEEEATKLGATAYFVKANANLVDLEAFIKSKIGN